MPGNQAFVPVEVGFIVDVTIADPGAGNQIAYTLPDDYLYKLELFYFLFEADGNVANRYIYVELIDGAANLRASLAALGSVGVNANVNFTYAKNMQHVVSTDLHRHATLPDAWIPGGWGLRTQMINNQVGDLFTNIRLTCARYREQN